MTLTKEIRLKCDDCGEEKIWTQTKDLKIDSVIKNAGFSKEWKSVFEGPDYYCPDCNDREKETFYVVDGRGEEYLGDIEAWGIVDARNVAWDTFECENMVKREKPNWASIEE